MAGTLAPPRRQGVSGSVVRTLSPRDLEALRLPGKFGVQSARRLLEQNPGRSVWVPATLEYALIGKWRNRPEIASVEDLMAVRHLQPLLQAAVERCAAQGDDLLLAIDLDSPRSRSRFERAGLEMLEEVITYEADIGRESWSTSGSLRSIRVQPDDVRSVDIVTKMDHVAFPWLWRNSRAEFDVYLRTPGVEVYFVEDEGELVAYIGLTLFPGWGHLDRIAVVPNLQGRGYGLEALRLAIHAMRQHGARRAGLSTQRTNLRSQRLYERFGFRRTTDHDYRLFGAWCQEDRRIG